ncbi:hypothetical protein OG216_26035 [Streptomycetaceae bacterium NBC_01309]
MIGISRTWLVDTAERAAWTAAQAGAGVVITAVTPLDTWWAAPIAVGLALLKAAAAKRIGDADSAAMLPTPKPDLGQALRGRP